MLFSISTFGCKVNQVESLELRAGLIERGFFPAADTAHADIHIINSCTVTSQSDKKAKALIQKLRRENPASIIALAGCFPQAFPEEAAQWNADIVIGVSNKGTLPELIQRRIEQRERIVEILPHTRALPTAKAPDTTKTRTFVKIQEGCDQYCSYCIIPFARGAARSKSLSDIRDEVRTHAINGHKEIVLTGINLTAFGKGQSLTLADAVETACAVPEILRVRLSSLEPDLMDKQLLERLSRQEKLCPHFHLSLQSGCDETLHRMKRHYTASDYASLCDALRGFFPNCAITTDMMVGFAGETDAEFEQSLSFVKSIEFARVHVFPYSVRDGTEAALRNDFIEEKIKSERYHRMQVLGETLKQAFLQSQERTIQSILVEKRTHAEYADGLTPNYTHVRVYGSDAKQHAIIKVKITAAKGGYCEGIEQT